MVVERVLGENPVIKLSKEGDMVKGKIMLINESKIHKGSYAMTLDNAGAKFVIFISEIVKNKLDSNGIVVGNTVKLTFKGTIKSKSTGRDINDIEVAVLE